MRSPAERQSEEPAIGHKTAGAGRVIRQSTAAPKADKYEDETTAPHLPRARTFAKNTATAPSSD